MIKYRFSAHVARHAVNVLKSGIYEYRRRGEEFSMRLGDAGCEGVFLLVGEGRVVGDDVKWHFER